jgi:hypothetical protein
MGSIDDLPELRDGRRARVAAEPWGIFGPQKRSRALEGAAMRCDNRLLVVGPGRSTRPPTLIT